LDLVKFRPINSFPDTIELKRKDIFLFYPPMNKDERLYIKNILSKSTLEKQFSHKINGRWENQYIDLDLIPEIKPVLLMACKFGNSIVNKSLVIPNKQFGFHYNEFWFNISNTGDSTGWHDHKENAKISGVYYISVPEKSGNIIFRKNDGNKYKKWFVKPEDGMMILFPSRLEHCVEINKSYDTRISLSFNLYTLPIEGDKITNLYSSKKFYS
tara:strand:- start:956 stop:1594 length:639 start_codon:yes stop_codon:yes gene_type:complete